MKRAASRLFVVAVLSFLIAAGSLAESLAQEGADEPAKVTIGYYISPPFVMKQNDRLAGMAVELWQELASGLNLQPEYHEYDTLRELTRATAAGDVDVALTNLTITRERAQSLDFTQPWFDAGLRIMIAPDSQTGFFDIVTELQDRGYLRAYAWLAFVILAATVLLTLFDRWFDADFPRRWRDGLAESFYTVMSVATSGRMPKRANLFGWIGRVWQGLWLICGIAVLAYVTSTVTSVMTTLSLTSQINSADDLPGKTVGVFTGSVAESFARNAGLRSISFPHIDEASQALRNGDVAAIIGDAPVLEYFAHTNPDLELEVVGAIFEPDKYGFGLTRGSALTRPLTVELLGAHESDLVEELRAKYFGDRN